MELVYLVLGVIMIYSTVHFFVIQKKAWDKRSAYEKVLSVVAMVCIGLLYLGVMFGD